LRRAWGKAYFGGLINMEEINIFDKLILKFDKQLRKSEILVDNIKLLADILEGDEPPEIVEEIPNEVVSINTCLEELHVESIADSNEFQETEMENIEQ